MRKKNEKRDLFPLGRSIFDTTPGYIPDELFERAEYDPTAGEKGGYSN